jgi:isoleucyl-tRNA synthetase
VSAAGDVRRRSCQTVLSLVVERLAGLIAPVLSHMAEDIWQNLPYAVAERSVFERGWPEVPEAWRTSAQAGYELATASAIRDLLLVLRPLVNRQLESCRKEGSLGASLEAQVQLEIADAADTAPLREALALLAASPHRDVDNLADWLQVSALSIGGPPPAAVLAEASEAGVTVRIARAEGQKCERCWHYEGDIGAHSAHPTLCGRCVAVLAG